MIPAFCVLLKLYIIYHQFNFSVKSKIQIGDDDGG